MIKADLHNHLSNFPYLFRLNEVADIASDRLGNEGILGIVNFEDYRYEKCVDSSGYERELKDRWLYVPAKALWIIKGQEITTKQGEILVFGSDKNKNFKFNRSLEDTLKEARDNELLVIVPHPFFIFGIGNYLKKNPELLKNVHAIETHNGEAFYGNKKARDYYNQIKKNYDLGEVFFSDGHSLEEIGSNYTFLEKPNNFEELKQSIAKHKDFRMDKQTSPIKLKTLDHSIKTPMVLFLKKIGIRFEK